VTESETVFLALGVLLGAAGGAALVMVLGTRLPRREIRVTVTRDAVPRRSPTLAIDAFVTSPAEPARGGPGDRRSVERTTAAEDPWSPGLPVGPGLMSSHGSLADPATTALRAAKDRTIVRSPSFEPSPEPAARLSADPATAVQTLEPRDVRFTSAGEDTRAAPPPGPAMLRILRGDHGAMLEVVDALAGADGRRRRDWEILLTGLSQAIAETAVDEGILDFPMGIPFWDAFTVEQCRELAASLASMGFRFDGRDAWSDGRVPGYRELGQALADVGLDPIRIRIWPNSSEIAQLLRGARPAADDLLARDAPDLRLEAVRELTRWHAESLSGLWVAWEVVRPLLLGEATATA